MGGSKKNLDKNPNTKEGELGFLLNWETVGLEEPCELVPAT